MNYQLVDVDDNAGEALSPSFHQLLEASQGSQKASGGGDSLVLTLPGDGEHCVQPHPGVEEELPEPNNEVNFGEDRASGLANFADALADFLQRILLGVAVGIEGPEVLNQANLAI